VVFDALTEIRDRGVTVLLVEQRAQRTVALADRTYVMTNGEIRMTLTRRTRTTRTGSSPRTWPREPRSGTDRLDRPGCRVRVDRGRIGLVFGVLRLINFAYGQLIMVAAYALVFPQNWPDAASIGLAVLAAVAVSLVMERVAFRPLRTAEPSTMLVRYLRDRLPAAERRTPAVHVSPAGRPR